MAMMKTCPSDLLFCPLEKPNKETESELVIRYRNMLVGLVSRRCKGRYLNSACGFEDYLQEAALALVLAARAYDPERGPFIPFAKMSVDSHLGRVKHRLTEGDVSKSTYVRHQEDMLHALPDFSDLDSAAPEAFTSLDDTRLDVAAFLKSLPDRDRSVLLALMRGDTEQEASRHAGCHRSTVRRVRHKCARRYAAENRMEEKRTGEMSS